jgi:hypothetical protein
MYAEPHEETIPSGPRFDVEAEPGVVGATSGPEEPTVPAWPPANPLSLPEPERVASPGSAPAEPEAFVTLAPEELPPAFEPMALVQPPAPSRSPLPAVIVLGLVVVAGLMVLLSFMMRGSRESYPVMVSSTPQGASIYVDGEKHFGTTPLPVHGLAPGKPHKLLIILEGFRPWQGTILLDGSAALRAVTAVPERIGPGGEPGSLLVDPSVADVDVYLDGEAQDGRAPLVLNRVRNGMSHTLLLRKQGYQDETVVVPPLAAGERQHLIIKMRPADQGSASMPASRPRKSKAGRKQAGGAAKGKGVTTIRRTPSLQSPIEGKIGEHLPKAHH